MSEPAFQHHRDIYVPGGGVWIDIGGGASFDGLLDPKPGLADSEVVPDPVAFFPPFRPGDGKVRAEPNWIYRLAANPINFHQTACADDRDEKFRTIGEWGSRGFDDFRIAAGTTCYKPGEKIDPASFDRLRSRCFPWQLGGQLSPRSRWLSPDRSGRQAFRSSRLG